MRLSSEQCVPCRGGEPSLTESEVTALHVHVPQWQLKEVDGVQRLERIFKLKNYTEAVTFTNKIAEIAEEEDHHPLIVLEWGRVTVQWWTHVVKGLHRNDFVMAAKTDQIFG